MATQSRSKMAKGTPKWHPGRTLGTPRGKQDGPKEKTVELVIGTKMITQSQRKMVKIAPRWPTVRTLVTPREDSDSPK